MMPILINSKKYFGRNLRNFNVKVEFISESLFDHINAGSGWNNNIWFMFDKMPQKFVLYGMLC